MAGPSEDTADLPSVSQDDIAGSNDTVPFVTPAPATTLRLIMGAIAMQAGSKMMSDAVDRAVHGSGPQGGDQAARPGKIKTTVAGKLAKIATKSRPGAIAVAGGLLAKHIFDRGGKRLQSKRDAAKRP